MEQPGSSEYKLPEYKLPPSRFWYEDILFCVDVDPETQAEMKSSVSKGHPQNRLDAVKQAITLFVNAKLSINPAHRFAFSVLNQSFSWVSTDLDLAITFISRSMGALFFADLSIANFTYLASNFCFLSSFRWRDIMGFLIPHIFRSFCGSEAVSLDYSSLNNMPEFVIRYELVVICGFCDIPP